MSSTQPSGTGKLAADFEMINAAYTSDDAADLDPYPMYREMREKMPVMKGDILARYGIPSQADYTNTGRPIYTLFKYDDVVKVLRDDENYSGHLMSEGLGPFVGDEMLACQSGDHHRRSRALMMQCFTPSLLRKWQDELVIPLIRSFLTPLLHKKRADLVSEFTMKFPVDVIYRFLGFPEDREASEQFAGWALHMLAGPQPDPEKAKIAGERAMEASRQLYAHISRIVADRRASESKGDDMISRLINAEFEGTRLNDHRITNMIRALLPAAAETTTRSIGNLIVHLLERPALLERIRKDRSLLPRAINESLRYEPTASFLARMAKRDMEIRGVKIPAGTALSLATASASRDEDAFPNGDTFDIDRVQTPMLAFGYGAHLCLGLQVAKNEIDAALNAVLDLLPNVRPDPDLPPPQIRGIMLRGPARLNVVWD